MRLFVDVRTTFFFILEFSYDHSETSQHIRFSSSNYGHVDKLTYSLAQNPTPKK